MCSPIPSHPMHFSWDNAVLVRRRFARSTIQQGHLIGLACTSFCLRRTTNQSRLLRKSGRPAGEKFCPQLGRCRLAFVSSSQRIQQVHRALQGAHMTLRKPKSLRYMMTVGQKQ